MDDTKRCPACAMEIPRAAEKCGHCRTRQPDAPAMHRGVPGRLLAGVCAALAHQMGVDAMVVRVAFAVAAVFSAGLACGVYLLLWAVTPPSAHGPSPLARLAAWLKRITSSSATPHTPA